MSEDASLDPPKLLDRVRAAIRVWHYSRRTEEACVHWIRRGVLFHNEKHPSPMVGEEINLFLSCLESELDVAASTQGQAVAAILFLYCEVLGES